MAFISRPLAAFPRLLVAVLALSVIPVLGAASSASATSIPATTDPLCVVHATSPIVESGEGLDNNSSIAAVIQVECDPTWSESTVEIDGTQLSDACGDTLSWSTPYDPAELEAGAQFSVTLDDDGNATAVVWGGPSCAASRNRIIATLEAPPFPQPYTFITIDPPVSTAVGVYPTPASEVEDSVYSSVATVVNVEFPSVFDGKTVTIKSDALYARCDGDLYWYGPEEAPLNGGYASPEATVTLDNDGNAFAIAFGSGSCAKGSSTITADLDVAPYTTKTKNFTIQSPRPTVPTP